MKIKKVRNKILIMKNEKNINYKLSFRSTRDLSENECLYALYN